MTRGFLIVLYPLVLSAAFLPVLFLYALLTPRDGGALHRPATLYLAYLLVAGWLLVRYTSSLPLEFGALLRMFRRHYLANVALFAAAVLLGQLAATVLKGSTSSAARDNTVAAASIASWWFLLNFVPFLRDAFRRPPRPVLGQLMTIDDANKRGASRRRGRDRLRAKDSSP